MKQEKRFIVDILFVLALFGVFAVSALVLVTIGADVYRHTVQDMSNNYDARTAIAYVTEKVRQHNFLLSDDTPAVTLSTLSGEPALILTSEVDGQAYDTCLYYHEGYLKELYMRKGAYLGENVLDAGQNILELSGLTFESVSENLLSVTMTTSDGRERKLLLSIRCPQDL